MIPPLIETVGYVFESVQLPERSGDSFKQNTVLVHNYLAWRRPLLGNTWMTQDFRKELQHMM